MTTQILGFSVRKICIEIHLDILCLEPLSRGLIARGGGGLLTGQDLLRPTIRVWASSAGQKLKRKPTENTFLNHESSPKFLIKFQCNTKKQSNKVRYAQGILPDAQKLICDIFQNSLSFGWLVNPAASNYRQTYWKIATKSFCFYRAVLIPLVYDIGSSGATFIQNNPAARAPAIGPSRCCGRRVLLDPSTYHSAYKAAGWNMTLWPSNNRGSIRTVRYSGDLLCNAGVESYKWKLTNFNIVFLPIDNQQFWDDYITRHVQKYHD